MSQAQHGKGYSITEMEGFLTIMKMVLPLSKSEWDTVEELHRDDFEINNCTAESICKKFKRLVKTGPPTGDPNCPEHIQHVKRLSTALFCKSEMGTRSNLGSETKTNNDNDYADDGNDGGDGNNRHEEEPEIVTLGQPTQESSPGQRKSPRK